MNFKPMLAIFWKEYRQLRGVYAGFILIILIFIIPNKIIQAPIWIFQEIYLGLMTIFPIMIAFFCGAGTRIVEKSSKQAAILHLRPIKRSHLLASYFLLGILGWMVWLAVYIGIQISFSGLEIFKPYRTYGSPLISYFNSTLYYFALYTFTFCVSALLPYLYLCSGLCFGMYILSAYWLVSDNWMRLDYYLPEFYPAVVYVVFLVPIPFMLYGTYQIYKQLQMGYR